LTTNIQNSPTLHRTGRSRLDLTLSSSNIGRYLIRNNALLTNSTSLLSTTIYSFISASVRNQPVSDRSMHLLAALTKNVMNKIDHPASLTLTCVRAN